MFATLGGIGLEAAQRQVLGALLDRHPAMVPADELRAELAHVHDIDQALTALIRDGLVTRIGELTAPAGRPPGRIACSQADQTPAALERPRGEFSARAPTRGMEIQPVTYRGRTVAACTADRFFLSDEMEARPPDDPVLTSVLAMMLYARDITHGLRPEPYRDADAIRHARRVLIPAELLERPTLDVVAAAAWLTIPAEELHAAQADHQARLVADWLIPPT